MQKYIQTEAQLKTEQENMRILIVDDNPEIREILKILLEGEGYETEEAENGSRALEKTEESEFDLIILDIMMPGMNGYQTCLEIRRRSNAPILLLSAKGQEGDKMLGFSSGGDDYLVKPFSYNELVSRVKALIRRYHVYRGKGGGGEENPSQNAAVYEMESGQRNSAVQKRTVLCCHGLEIDEALEQVTKNGKIVDLTDTEYRMLYLLIKNQHQIFSAERLYEAVWEEQYYYGANNTVMVHIRNLRRKIETDPANPVMIKTVWGRGYRCD